MRYWLIWFEDQDRKPEIFDDEQAAKERFMRLSVSWNCHLFMECPLLNSSNEQPPVPQANAGGKTE